MMFEISNRDHGEFLVEELNLEAQLAAGRSLLRRHREADDELNRDISEIAEAAKKASGEYGMHLENLWVDQVHSTVFQGAAHSMSALGMLAPLTESLFVAMFAAIDREKLFASADIKGPRASLSATQLWDPHWVALVNRRTGKISADRELVPGIGQLAEVTGLAAHLPAGWEQRIEAFFRYRNKMFHHGFEWPVDERKAFSTAIKKWPNGWFLKSESNREPSIFYLSDEFIRDCLTMIEAVIEGTWAYLVARLHKKD
ncbi:hypothetical protein AAG607_07505 [Citromicrobium bathyomarinum]|jgi:hypothetical protein|uniref:hypothetical protein n=2 Tax=Alphaproteobacteria TaxID=28211 RepID=UPI000C1058F0|nr:MAG: hypothetical protein COA64_16610 [Henriciella sp.]